MTGKKSLQTALDDNPHDDPLDHNVFELDEFLKDRQPLISVEIEDMEAEDVFLELDDSEEDWWDDDAFDDKWGD